MDNQTNLNNRAYIAIGLMLFALFFGAGNLIFPAALGQQAGENVWWAILGFIITGVGLPLLGVMAMGYSGSKDVQALASRVHPVYGFIYTVLLYLAIGPAFAIPRTGTVSYEIAVKPFLANGGSDVMQGIVLAIFFGVTLWLAINPAKLVDRIGKVLTPLLLLTICILIAKSLITPMGDYMAPMEQYATPSTAVLQGFLDGYNTLDALASLVFAILVIQFVTLSGAKTKEQITSATFKAGIIAVACLGFVYVFIANLGATSVEQLGVLDTGAPVLAGSARILIGNVGAIVLAIIVLLACLTTSIGLVTSCATYFNRVYSGLGYKTYAVLFSVVSFFIGMFGLKTIIVSTIPVLMFLYPLTIVIIALAFLDRLFDGRQCVYAWSIGLTLIAAFVSGAETAGVSLGAFGEAFAQYVPFHAVGMSWVPFAVVGFVVGLINKALVKKAAVVELN
ncbi:branched-chain amino acid transport system II carrier protein [uncultured Veillonella sp.]|uniref:branched-chain amino acid transport system II carrier protein n=1 Tax=uncultured Veillonella sp. TaxID=159268 RepID=UPI00263557DF|nr:branched-chain amino acid transport system II carrier protein [uncultured Veillonella sp.]